MTAYVFTITDVVRSGQPVDVAGEVVQPVGLLRRLVRVTWALDEIRRAQPHGWFGEGRALWLVEWWGACSPGGQDTRVRRPSPACVARHPSHTRPATVCLATCPLPVGAPAALTSTCWPAA
jgi:hypothetical protein